MIRHNLCFKIFEQTKNSVHRNFTNFFCDESIFCRHNDRQVSHANVALETSINRRKTNFAVALESISSTFYARLFCTKVFWAALSLLGVWLWTNFRKKNARIKCWRNWHLVAKKYFTQKNGNANGILLLEKNFCYEAGKTALSTYLLTFCYVL